jgi:diguanylate cyclase (GGDEF)-like protein/putative nucleotidyltransferase with HDIG domain
MIDDVGEIRFRLDSVAAGTWITYIVCAAGGIYVAVFPDLAYRSLMGAMFAAGLAGGLVVATLPWERIIRSRWREPAFLAWSILDLGLIATMVALDGKAQSPLALLFFIPVVFAGMSYPRPSVVALSVLTLGAYLAVGLSTGSEAAYVLMFEVALSCTALMSLWQARNHERRSEQLATVSRTDPLTGCLNRRGFSERGRTELDHATRTGKPCSLILLDLDAFKEVNDMQGHGAGDALLCRVVTELETVLRPMDAIGRLGGDEFALLLPDSGRAGGDAATQRVRDVLAPVAPASVGFATYPVDGTDLDALLRIADAQLYESKATSREAASSEERLSWAATLAHAVDLRMDSRHEHSPNVALLAVAIAQRLGWTDEELGSLRIAAMLHDVGKAEIPDSILRKPGKLSPEEFTEIKQHPLLGAGIVERVDGLEDVVPWIRHAHEHWDGSGYPDGLAGENIPLASRVLLVADAFDAMTSPRPYRDPLPPEEAIEELVRHRGTQFDASCVDALVAHLRTPVADADAAR